MLLYDSGNCRKTVTCVYTTDVSVQLSNSKYHQAQCHHGHG